MKDAPFSANIHVDFWNSPIHFLYKIKANNLITNSGLQS